MKIIVSPRGRGKTQFLLRYVMQNIDSMLLVATLQEKQDLQRKLQLLQQPDAFYRVFSVEEFRENQSRGLGVTVIVIDDLERVLPALLGMPVSYMTTSTEIIHLNPQITARLHENEAGQKFMVPPPAKDKE